MVESPGADAANLQDEIPKLDQAFWQTVRAVRLVTIEF